MSGRYTSRPNCYRRSVRLEGTHRAHRHEGDVCGRELHCGRTHRLRARPNKIMGVKYHIRANPERQRRYRYRRESCVLTHRPPGVTQVREHSIHATK